jgi:hypothetical protein
MTFDHCKLTLGPKGTFKKTSLWNKIKNPREIDTRFLSMLSCRHCYPHSGHPSDSASPSNPTYKGMLVYGHEQGMQFIMDWIEGEGAIPGISNWWVHPYPSAWMMPTT